MIPLILKIKKQKHREIAKTQDLVVEELYKHFNNAVLHGGTAIWRCYKGNRFSEDIDIYMPRNVKIINELFESLKRKGFIVKKKKIGERSLFSVLELNRTEVRLEGVFKQVHAYLKEYETIDGNLITIYTLSPEELIKEKVDTYTNRQKIRDLYDIFFLLRYANNIKYITKNLSFLINNFRMPNDAKELKVLIIEGLTPDVNKMLVYIKDLLKWEKKNI